MKKAASMVFILVCVLLSACGNAKSIGIIGGSDGPTANYKACRDVAEKVGFEPACP